MVFAVLTVVAAVVSVCRLKRRPFMTSEVSVPYFASKEWAFQLAMYALRFSARANHRSFSLVYGLSSFSGVTAAYSYYVTSADSEIENDISSQSVLLSLLTRPIRL